MLLTPSSLAKCTYSVSPKFSPHYEAMPLPLSSMHVISFQLLSLGSSKHQCMHMYLLGQPSPMSCVAHTLRCFCSDCTMDPLTIFFFIFLDSEKFSSCLIVLCYSFSPPLYAWFLCFDLENIVPVLNVCEVLLCALLAPANMSLCFSVPSFFLIRAVCVLFFFFFVPEIFIEHKTNNCMLQICIPVLWIELDFQWTTSCRVSPCHCVTYDVSVPSHVMLQ